MLGATNVVVAAAALGARERGQRVDGGAGARVRVEADTSLRADGAPQASELPAADRPGPRARWHQAVFQHPIGTRLAGCVSFARANGQGRGPEPAPGRARARGSFPSVDCLPSAERFPRAPR